VQNRSDPADVGAVASAVVGAGIGSYSRLDPGVQVFTAIAHRAPHFDEGRAAAAGPPAL
jgi:hypothetical protein